MKKFKNNRHIFKIIFIISITAILICFLYRIVTSYFEKKYTEDSDILVDTYKLVSIYSDYNKSNYILLSSYPIIGKIEIPKLQLMYPIISNISEEYLKIAPCRFSGPLPNEIGNLCIAGHNYNNNKFFSNIYILENNDIIKIYDLNDNYIIYKVISKFEVEESNLSVLNQSIVNSRELTLLTCNNYNKKRIIIKAKEANY